MNASERNISLHYLNKIIQRLFLSFLFSYSFSILYVPAFLVVDGLKSEFSLRTNNIEIETICFFFLSYLPECLRMRGEMCAHMLPGGMRNRRQPAS